MCRNIKPLFNFDPPATPDEINDAALQYVRKISGFTKPSETNNRAFTIAVEGIAAVTTQLVFALKTTAEPKNREIEAAKAQARAVKRFQ
jgi:hypothetical protein